jgi:hypothetical protein
VIFATSSGKPYSRFCAGRSSNGPLYSQPEHLGALHFADDLVRLALPGLHLEVLLDGDEVGHLLQPRARLPTAFGLLVVGALAAAARHAVQLERPLRDVIDLTFDLQFE